MTVGQIKFEKPLIGQDFSCYFLGMKHKTGALDAPVLCFIPTKPCQSFHSGIYLLISEAEGQSGIKVFEPKQLHC